jgi:hypothetical protein
MTRAPLTHTCFHPYKFHSETYNNRYAKIQKLMTWLDGATLHHMWVLRIFTSKSPRVVQLFCALLRTSHLLAPLVPNHHKKGWEIAFHQLG